MRENEREKKGLGFRHRQLMANNGLSGHVAGTSALPPIADIGAPMSAFLSIWSASPPGADLPGGVAESPFLTLSRHWVKPY